MHLPVPEPKRKESRRPLDEWLLRQRAWVEDNTGPLDVWLLRQRPQLEGYPVSPVLAGLVDRFWAVHWDMAVGVTRRQEVLADPGAILRVGHRTSAVGGRSHEALDARLDGMTHTLKTRFLAGSGWTVAAVTIPGGIGAFISGSASSFTDRVVGLGHAVALDEAALVGEMATQPDEASRVDVLSRALEDVVKAADPERVRRARHVASLSRLVETDPSIRRLSDLYAKADVGPKDLQRLFVRYAGVSPAWVVRRYRLLDMAAAFRDGQPIAWDAAAAELGYADPAHLVRDFRIALGKTSAADADSPVSS